MYCVCCTYILSIFLMFKLNYESIHTPLFYNYLNLNKNAIGKNEIKTKSREHFERFWQCYKDYFHSFDASTSYTLA